MIQYRERARQRDTGVTYAARYDPGHLDNVSAVAREKDSDAQAVEVPALNIAIIRHWDIPGHPDYAPRVDYKIVEAGHFLAYSESYDLLHTIDPNTFARNYELNQDSS